MSEHFKKNEAEIVKIKYRKSGVLHFFASALGIGLIATCALSAFAQQGTQNENQSLGNVKIAGVSVRGLTPQQARQRLAVRLQPRLKTKVTFTDGIKTVSRRRLDLGIQPDVQGMVAHAKSVPPRAGKSGTVPLRWTVNRIALQRALRRVAPKFAFPGRNPRLVEQRGRLRILPPASSRAIDVGTSAQRLANLLEQKPDARLLRLAITKKPPGVTTADLKGITGRLSRFTTYFNNTKSRVKRVHNMRLAASRIDGTLLPPGKSLSLNQAIGERTQQHGFRTAPVFENRMVVPGIGGGVSQVTGTLFNAALLAGLSIEEYVPHSMPVPYLPPGRDATLAWDQNDLKIKNTTGAPVYIAYHLSGNRLTATVYGKKPPAGRRVTLKVNKKSLGKQRLSTELYRIIKQNGKVIRKERIGRAVYALKPAQQMAKREENTD